MASKKGKAAKTDEELSKLFEGIGDTSDSTPQLSSSDGMKSGDHKTTGLEQDPLAELASLAQQRPSSRPHTPKVSSVAAGSAQSPKKDAIGSTRSSEDKASATNIQRKSGESTRSFHKGLTPVHDPGLEKRPSTEELEGPPQGGESWWGGIFATASAAVKTAEAAVKEIQQNEEAKKWAEQVKGNVGALRDLGGELKSRAMPTFSNILQTIAPPISSHERLQIHITHDFVGYPLLDPLIYQTFSRIMAQVEGGDLMVIQRGHESSPRRASDAGFTGSGSASWSDGPWWRQPSERRSLGAVKGLVEGTKLVKVSAESYAADFFAPRGGVEEAAKNAAEVLSQSNPVRSSDIFLAIQAIYQTPPENLFGGPLKEKLVEGEAVANPEEESEELVSFAVYLYDPIHGITFQTITQTFPKKWVDWLDAPSAPESLEGPPSSPTGPQFPEEIAEIIATGGVDPREWVAEWVEEVLVLGVGIVAQRYVARRMGVGHGGIGRGKARQEAVESGGGEAARAI